MQSSQTIGFHESTLVGVHRAGGTITLELEDVHLGDEIHSAVIRLSGVKSLTQDGTAVEDLILECKDGEILTLQHTETAMQLIIEWTDFKKHLSETHSYRIIFDSIETEIGPAS